MNYKNTKIEDEILDADEREIRALLSDLKRIDAPADFDFRLKSHIARAEPNFNRAPRFVPQFLRYALPLGLVILISAFVFNGVYFTNKQNVEPVAESRNPAAENLSDESAATVAARKADENISTAPIETARVSDAPETKIRDSRTIAKSTSVAVETGRKAKSKISGEKNADKDLSSSRDAALMQETKIITPPGINSNRTVSASPNAENGKSLTVKEVLSQLGVDANFERESWRVKSVVKNSLAERSGVRAGDAVEAIDGERLTDKPLKNKTVEGKKLTVARGAEKIEISLTNKSN